MVLIGRLLDRMTFWNMPAVIQSFVLPVPYHSYEVDGLEVWFIPGSEDGPTVLYCHGNAGNLRFPTVRRDRFLTIHKSGANLWVFDYRGFGRSRGRPTELGLYEDAHRVHNLARSHHPEGRPFVLYGRSLGGAVATYLATEICSPELLILESTFTSVPSVCASLTHPSVAALMSYQFNSLERFARLTCPLKMIHGTADRIVSFRLGRELYQRCPTAKEFLAVEGAGHNNIQAVSGGLYESTLARWLSFE